MDDQKKEAERTGMFPNPPTLAKGSGVVKFCYGDGRPVFDEDSKPGAKTSRTPDLAALLDDLKTLEAIVEVWAEDAGIPKYWLNPRQAQVAIDVIKRVAGI